MDELHYGPSRPVDQHSHSDLLGSPRQEMDGGSLLCSQVSLSSPPDGDEWIMMPNGLCVCVRVCWVGGSLGEGRDTLGIH